MRKPIIFVLSMVLCVGMISKSVSVSATNIDKKKASQVGAYFMAAQFGNKSITPNTLTQVYEFPNAVLGIPALYIFNTSDNRGFVVVSGSDCIVPVVFYSTEGSFDPNNIPPNMMWWLGGIADAVIYAQNEQLEPAPEINRIWDELIEQRLPYFGADSKGITKLMNSKWNQSPLYNSLCPSDGGGQCVTGCVATAMAQIIYYWKYPVKGKSVTSYHWNDTVLTVNFTKAFYDYDNMVDMLTENSTQEQINAVALLNYHCGVSVKMGYSSDQSGAHSEDAETAFYKNFKYVRDSIQFLSRDDARFRNTTGTPNAKDTLWVYTIAEQIMKKRPVFYAGDDPSGGDHSRHAFVCDGWNANTQYMHFNWGWGGSGDGYCNVFTSRLNAMLGHIFTHDHRVILGITPPLDSIPENQRPGVGIDNIENTFTSSIYPNPASHSITVEYMLNGNSDVDMQIIDMTGHVVRTVAVHPASRQTTISVEDLRPGVYFCRLQGRTTKFVVAN